MYLVYCSVVITYQQNLQAHWWICPIWANFILMRRWKRLFVNGWEYNSPVPTVTECLSPFLEETTAAICSGAKSQNDDNSAWKMCWIPTSSWRPVCLSLHFNNQNFAHISRTSHACCMNRSSNPYCAIQLWSTSLWIPPPCHFHHNTRFCENKIFKTQFCIFCLWPFKINWKEKQILTEYR